MCIYSSVVDPFHFNADPDSDPDPQIRFRDDGSGSGSEVTFPLSYTSRYLNSRKN